MLRPFFSYYGGKWRAAERLYPEPTHGTIIEPFAGSAGYSTRYYDRRIVLYDSSEVVCGVWDYLIHASESDILSLPDIKHGQDVRTMRLPQEARWLIGFWLNKGSAAPRNIPSRWMRDGLSPTQFWCESIRQRIASQLKCIRHWQVHNLGYEWIDSVGPATWFIDPPYVGYRGNLYPHGSSGINYRKLAHWCRLRVGQVIVCEGESADWLPFERVGGSKGTFANVQEYAWIRNQ